MFCHQRLSHPGRIFVFVVFNYRYIYVHSSFRDGCSVHLMFLNVLKSPNNIWRLSYKFNVTWLTAHKREFLSFPLSVLSNNTSLSFVPFRYIHLAGESRVSPLIVFTIATHYFGGQLDLVKVSDLFKWTHEIPHEKVFRFSVWPHKSRSVAWTEPCVSPTSSARGYKINQTRILCKPKTLQSYELRQRGYKALPLGNYVYDTNNTCSLICYLSHVSSHLSYLSFKCIGIAFNIFFCQYLRQDNYLLK